VKTKSGQVHILRLFRGVQSVEQTADALNPIVIKPASVVFCEERIQPFVPKRADHSGSYITAVIRRITV
jgi:hypothetical protein